MGYAIVVSPCLVCRRPFGYNPNLVPSHPARNGEPSLDPTDPKQPICLECVKLINEARAMTGAPQWPIHPDAYEPVDEGMI